MFDFLRNNRVVRAMYSGMPALQDAYHYTLSFLGAFVHGFPSRKMIVIGVTGTKGKTTVCNIIAHMLQSAGHKTGIATTVNFKIGEREWVNDTKQTMLGRFGLQEFLREMADQGCEYAVIETSSEGILQYRHRFIDYDVAVFTNISPEHIERHGSFELYRAAKVKLFERVAKKKNGVGVYNLDDKNSSYFLEPNIPIQYGYTIRDASLNPTRKVSEVLRASNVSLGAHGSKMVIGRKLFRTSLVGEMNVYNVLTAIAVALSQGVSKNSIQKSLETLRPIPGRFEVLGGGSRLLIVIDYAHEPASLEAAYKTAALFKPRKIIGVLGSQGGGRDKWKRAAMGKILAERAEYAILTSEDPYNEDPMSIIRDIEKGILMTTRNKTFSIERIMDREKAIQRAMSMAGKNDLVMITGKGGEVWMCVEGGKKIPWSDKEIVEEVLQGKEKSKK